MLGEKITAEYDNLDVIFQKALKMLRSVPADQRDAYYTRLDAAIGNSGQPVMKRLNALELVMKEIKALMSGDNRAVNPDKHVPAVGHQTPPKTRTPGPVKHGGTTRPTDANWGHTPPANRPRFVPGDGSRK